MGFCWCDKPLSLLQCTELKQARGKGWGKLKHRVQGRFSERYICLSANERPMKLQMHLNKCPSKPWVRKWYPGGPHLPILSGFFDLGYTVRFQACPRELRIFLCLLRAFLGTQLVKWDSSHSGNQPWIFIGRTDAEVEAPIFWSADAKSGLIRKDSDAGWDWGQEEKGMTEDEMVGWHHWFNGHAFWANSGREWRTGKPGVLQFVGHKELDMTWWLNNNSNNSTCP